MDGLMNRQMSGWIEDGQWTLDRWMPGCMDKWMDR